MPTIADRIRHACDLAQSTYQEWGHLQRAFPNSQCADYWVWFNTHGWKEIPGVASALPPIPDSEVFQFSNTSYEWGYLLTAGATYKALTDALSSLSLSLGDMDSVLDFGCGPGRGVRCFFKHAETLRVFGCDVDSVAIDWCQKNLPFGAYAVNDERPPLPYEENSMDLAFAVSVFSHLSEESHLAWLAELRRVLRPGGIVVLTIHGEHALRRTINEPAIFDMVKVRSDLLDAARKTVFDQKGFAFLPQPDGHLTTDLYGVTFIHRDYIQSTWSKDFEVVGCSVATIDNWQDAVVLRAKG